MNEELRFFIDLQTIVCICDCLFPPKPTVIIEEDRNRQALANRKKVTEEASKVCINKMTLNE